MSKLHVLIVAGRPVKSVVDVYANGRTAIQYIMGEHERYAVLTCNLPNETLAYGEFFIKTWSENTKLAEGARKSGHYEDTGRRVKAGFCEAEVWRFAPSPSETPTDEQ